MILDDIQSDKRLNYLERLITILDKKIKCLCNKVVNLVKVKWKHRMGLKWTWDPKEEIRGHYTHLFIVADFEDEV